MYLCVSLQVLFVRHAFLDADYCFVFCELFVLLSGCFLTRLHIEAGHYYSLCWQQYEMCGPAMAAAIAAADNVTNVRCPGFPVPGVTGWLQGACASPTFDHPVHCISLSSSGHLGSLLGSKPQAEVAVMSSLPRISVQRFVKCEGSPAWMSKRSKFWNMIKM